MAKSLFIPVFCLLVTVPALPQEAAWKTDSSPTVSVGHSGAVGAGQKQSLRDDPSRPAEVSPPLTLGAAGSAARLVATAGHFSLMGATSRDTVSAGGLQIIPTFDSSITTNPNADAIEDAIKDSISVFETLFSDPITVRILFRYSTTQIDGSPAALGNSDFRNYSMPYATYITALKAHSMSANDLIAINNLPSTGLTSSIYMHAPLGRALGMNTPGSLDPSGAVNTGGTLDGIVTLNSAQPIQFDRTGGIGLESYDARCVLEHEIDEVMGLSSALPSTGFEPEDLFRFSAPGLRSLTSNPGATAYFSIDNGITNIVSLNQSGGDFGDWFFSSCPSGATTQLVQTFGLCPGLPADVSATSPEGIALDVIGFTLRTGTVSQTITFPELSNVNIGTAPFALRASASSGLAVSFTSDNTSVCTVAGATVTLVTVGACSISASQPGSSVYAAAVSVIRTFIITRTGAETSIAINNAGFETLPSNPNWLDCSQYAGPGCRFTGDGNVPGWTGTGENGFLQIGPKNLFNIPMPAAEGQTVAQINSGYLSQTLNATLQVSTTYTFQVDVGRRLDNLYSAPPPMAQLFAGNTLIASATGPQPPLGGWIVWTGTYQSSASDRLAGQVLRIVLSVTNPQGNFDNAHLTTAPAAGTLAPLILPGGIVPIGSTVNTIQPGEWVSIFGVNLANATENWDGTFQTSLGGTTVVFNGKPGYLSYVSPTQINVQAPDDSATGPIPVTVTTSNGSSTSTVTLARFGPSFLLLDDKHVAGLILRQDNSGTYGGGTYDILGPTGNSLGYSTVAAQPGDELELFAVGLGATNPAVPAGQAFSGAAPVTNPMDLLINNVSVTQGFVGLAIAGVYQINLRVPTGLGTGDVSIVARIGGVQTPLNIVISLQGSSTPQILLTRVPPYGSDGILQGQVRNVDPSANTVVCYIYVAGQWWLKPTFLTPLTQIQKDGSWSCLVETNDSPGFDDFATEFAVFAIPRSYNPPLLGGDQNLPGDLYQASLANTLTYRPIVSSASAVALAPSSINFVYVPHSPALPSSYLAATSTPVGALFTTSVSSNCNWLVFNAGSGVTPVVDLYAALNTTVADTLAPGNYTCTITASAPGPAGGLISTTVPAKLTVTTAEPSPISVRPESWTFLYPALPGPPIPPGTPPLVVSSSSGGLISPTKGAGCEWLTLNGTNWPEVNSTVPATLKPGAYPCVVTFTGASTTGSASLTLTLVVLPPLTASTFTVDPTSMTFNYVQHGGALAAYIMSATSSYGPYGVPVTAALSSGCTWLDFSPFVGARRTTNFRAALDTTVADTLSPATYTCSIMLTTPGTLGGPITATVSVVLTIAAPTIAVNPASATLNYPPPVFPAGTPPFSVRSSIGGVVTPSLGPGCNWLDLSGTLDWSSPVNLNVGVNTSAAAKLKSGNYACVVTFTAPNVPGSADVSLTLIVK